MSEEEKTAVEETPPEATAVETEGDASGEAAETTEEAAGSTTEAGEDEASAKEGDPEGGGEPPTEEDSTVAEERSEPDGEGTTEVRQAEFQPITPSETIATGENISLLLGVVVPVTIDLGGTNMPLEQVLALGPGSVVKLYRPLGEPVDIKVNGERIGRGEVVVVDDQFGVQVTELCTPSSAAKVREK